MSQEFYETLGALQVYLPYPITRIDPDGDVMVLHGGGRYAVHMPEGDALLVVALLEQAMKQRLFVEIGYGQQIKQTGDLGNTQQGMMPPTRVLVGVSVSVNGERGGHFGMSLAEALAKALLHHFRHKEGVE